MRTFLRVIAALIAALTVPIAVMAVTTASTFAAIHPPRGGVVTPASVAAAVPHAHDPTKQTAVVVIGDHGAVVSDVLAPYEVLAQTGRFNVYTVAPERRPLTLSGGLDIVPDLTFAQLDERLSGAAPDLVVVPAMPDVGEPSAAPVSAWLRQEAQRGALMLSVCNGSGVLATAGLLDGRAATAHWLRISTFEGRFPAVNWVRGPRYVDDGNIVSTAGILSSIDGTLWVIERLAGRETAVQAAAAVGWHRYVPGAQSPGTPAAIAASDAVVALNVGFRWDPSTLGVVLTDGVGELELASVFDSYGAQSFAARTLAVSETGDIVRSRHGLVFVPRADVRSAADRIDRLVVPGADAARRHDVDPAGFRGTPEYLHERPGFAFDAAVIDIARTIDVSTARWTAKILEYPIEGVELAGQSWPWQLALRPIALALAGLAAGIALFRLVRRYREHPVWIFVRHYLEMVVAMLVGMFALGALWMLVPGLAEGGAAHVLVMAVDMTIGMAAWMLVRRHRWPVIAEMSAAMVAPFVVLLVPYWMGAISISTVSGLGHVLMLVCMLLAMLLRRDEYTHPHGSHAPDPVPTPTGV